MASESAVVDELMEIYNTYRPAAEVAAQRIAILHSLNEEQFEVLQYQLLTRNKTGEETQLAIVEDVMSDLILHSNFSIDILLKAQLEAGWTPLDYLFRGAGELAEKELWSRLEANPTLCLSGLAWIDRTDIVERFAQWKIDAPKWHQDFVAERYTHLAGWELNDAYEKRWLFSTSCYGLRSHYEEQNNQTEQAQHAEPKEQSLGTSPSQCLWCKRPTFVVKNLTSTYLKELFDIVVNPTQISIPFCLHCTNYGAVPMQLTASGCTEFSKHNDPKRLIDEPLFPLNAEGGNLHLQVDSYARNPYSAVDSGRTYNLSQIGGFPTWPQSAQYPKCVECSQSMLFFMQVESMDFPILQYEGIYHLFICQHCTGQIAVQQSR